MGKKKLVSLQITGATVCHQDQTILAFLTPNTELYWVQSDDPIFKIVPKNSEGKCFWLYYVDWIKQVHSIVPMEQAQLEELPALETETDGKRQRPNH